MIIETLSEVKLSNSLKASPMGSSPYHQRVPKSGLSRKCKNKNSHLQHSKILENTFCLKCSRIFEKSTDIDYFCDLCLREARRVHDQRFGDVDPYSPEPQEKKSSMARVIPNRPKA